MTNEEFIENIISAGFKITKDPVSNKYYVVDNIKQSIMLDNNNNYLYKDYKSAAKGYVYRLHNFRSDIENNILKFIRENFEEPETEQIEFSTFKP